MKYIVIADINKTSYMVSVEASSFLTAEHIILDMAYCGKHEYGVDGAIAFDFEGMKYDQFIEMAKNSQTVSLTEIMEIIAENNRRIETKDLAEKRIEEINDQIKKLTEELENAKRILAN